MSEGELPKLSTEPVDVSRHVEGTAAQKVAWCLYDWANSGFALIMTGPLFSPYFVGKLLPEQPSLPMERDGSFVNGLMWGTTFVPATAVFGVLTAIVALMVTVSAPLLGALADLRGWAKGLLITCASAGSAVACFAYFLSPGAWVFGAIIYIISSFFFATSLTFYNAFLPVLTSPDKQGRLSGWGFGVGYVGGALGLITAYNGVYQALGFSFETGLAFAGVWWLVFSLPAFVLLPRVKPVAVATNASLLSQSVGRLVKTFKNIRQYKMLFLFLIAFLIYNNGIDTVINLSPAFGEDVLNMTSGELIKMFLIVQFVAFGGAIAFGYIADRFGNKVVIVSNLLVWCAAVLGVAFVQTAGQFTLLGVLIGLVLGGVQSSSRALMARLAPKEIHNEAFGFFSLSGKAISIFGPLLFAAVATGLGPRYGVFAVLPFLVVGLVLILMVKEPRRAG